MMDTNPDQLKSILHTAKKQPDKAIRLKLRAKEILR